VAYGGVATQAAAGGMYASAIAGWATILGAILRRRTKAFAKETALKSARVSSSRSATLHRSGGLGGWGIGPTRKLAEHIPPAGEAFAEWFDSLTVREFEELWAISPPTLTSGRAT